LFGFDAPSLLRGQSSNGTNKIDCFHLVFLGYGGLKEVSTAYPKTKDVHGIIICCWSRPPNTEGVAFLKKLESWLLLI
jgi:hypothetical protein